MSDLDLDKMLSAMERVKQTGFIPPVEFMNYEKYLRKTKMHRRAVIVDLDGTLYNCEERRKRCFTEEKKDFTRWDAEAGQDPSNGWCIDLVWAMSTKLSKKIIFVSGRSDKHRDEVHLWMAKHLIEFPLQYGLHMRPEGDFRKDSELKKEIYFKEIEPYYTVDLCIDDRQQVVDMWRSLGLVCLQCAPGGF